MRENSLRKILPYLVIVFCIAYIFFSQKNPCNSPITYKIGTFDKQFGISEQDFLKDVNQGAEVWNKAIGKEVLKYDKQGGEVVINLVYDERQKTTETNAKLQADAIKINTLASTVKKQYQELDLKYKTLEKEYAADVNQFKQHTTDYNSQVSYWNAKGGAPKEIYTALSLKKESLLVEQFALETKRNEINTLVEQINTFITNYNLLVNSANNVIDTINTTAGKEFEEGNYDPTQKSIAIYEFSTNKKLLRVITHELGHALNLPHNENPKSIMYALNQANTLSLSVEDVSALQLRCQVSYPFIFFYTNLKEKLSLLLP